MKNIPNLNTSRLAVLLLLVIGIFAGSCKKDILDEVVRGEDKPLELTASKQNIVLNEKEYGNDAIELKWTNGTNNGTNSAISYALYIDKAGNNFKDALMLNMGNSTFSKKYTIMELNQLLVDELHLSPGVESTVEVKLESTVAVNAKKESVTANFKVTPYQAVSAKLFLIGDAAPNGWDAGNATSLVYGGAPGKFTWQGRLSRGEFKFITTKGQFTPSYVKGASDSQLVLRTADNQPDDKLKVDKGGLYNITVDLLNLSVSIEEGNAPPYEALWIVGDATPNGWNIDDPNPMRVDRSDPFIFSYSGVLNAGEFKIPTSKGNWGTDFYMPFVNYQDLASTDVKLVPNGSPDNKWKIVNPGIYKIKLDLLNNKITIKPFTPFTEIWLVGDATPNGWDIGNATPMVVDPSNPSIFTYTGPMTPGEFKLALQKNFNGDYFMPVIAGEGAESTEMKFVPGGSPDNKWKLTEAGRYKITMDQSKDTIKIEKL